MRTAGSSGKLPFRLSFALILPALLGLSACLGSGSPIGDPDALVAAAPAPDPAAEEAATRQRLLAALVDYCPPVEIKLGATAYSVYERGGEGEPSRLRYQASLSQFPRSCVDEAGTLTIQLGLAGYLLAGPRGGPGSVTIPLHVQVVQDIDTVVFDRVFPTPASIPVGAVRGEYSRVEAIVVPSPPRENMRIVIGFDQPR
jgi:hypothetical protein